MKSVMFLLVQFLVTADPDLSRIAEFEKEYEKLKNEVKHLRAENTKLSAQLEQANQKGAESLARLEEKAKKIADLQNHLKEKERLLSLNDLKKQQPSTLVKMGVLFWSIIATIVGGLLYIVRVLMVNRRVDEPGIRRTWWRSFTLTMSKSKMAWILVMILVLLIASLFAYTGAFNFIVF